MIQPEQIRPGSGPLHGPDFSSFRRDEVGWLLADYTHVQLERDIAERERDIQSGKSHYADDLPVELPPNEQHTALFDAALSRNAVIVATAVARVADEISYRIPDGEVVLVSLARAGVPAGVWIQHRLKTVNARACQHYAISIIKGRGVDRHALAWIAVHHDPRQVVFVDGWSGKGAIRRELRQFLLSNQRSCEGLFPDRLAVLADPAGAADIAGTRDDILIPTACLNSTSCGLVSRTVLPRLGVSSSQYHGARMYPEHARFDRTRQAIDAVNACSAGISSDTGFIPQAVPLPNIWQLAQRLGIGDVILMKPGLGETTRVLQRRVPWSVLVHPDWMKHADLSHILALAAYRGTQVVPADTWPYRCIGVIRPQRLASHL